jgi:hypothetical protein
VQCPVTLASVNSVDLEVIGIDTYLGTIWNRQKRISVSASSSSMISPDTHRRPGVSEDDPGRRRAVPPRVWLCRTAVTTVLPDWMNHTRFYIVLLEGKRLWSGAAYVQ